MNLKNLDNLLKNSEEKIKNFSVKFGKNIVPAMLIATFLLNPVLSNANSLENNNLAKEAKLINQTKKTELTGKEVSKNSIDVLKHMVELSIDVSDLYQNSNYKSEHIIEKKGFGSQEDYQTFKELPSKTLDKLKELEKRYEKILKINISNDYSNGKFENVANHLKNTTESFQAKIEQYMNNSFKGNSDDLMKENITKMDKEIDSLNYLILKSQNKMIEMELKGEKTGLSIDDIDKMIVEKEGSYKTMYTRDIRNRYSGLEENKKITKEIETLKQVKEIVEKRLSSVNYNLKGSQQSLNFN